MSILRAELYKLKRTNIWIAFLVNPILTGLFAISMNPSESPYPWAELYHRQFLLHGQLFLPLMACLITAYLCKFEHDQNNWKQYLTKPIQRWQVYAGKFTLSVLFVGIMQLLMLAVYLSIGWMLGIDGSPPSEMIVRGIVGGWIGTFPLIALQLWMSSIWKSFAGAMSISVMFTLPSILIANSATYGPYYPWAQPFLLTIAQSEQGNVFYVSLVHMALVLGGSILLFFGVGVTQFKRRAF